MNCARELSDSELDTVSGGNSVCPISDEPTGHVVQCPIGYLVVSCGGYPDNTNVTKVTYHV
jgi:hypothetical protein